MGIFDKAKDFAAEHPDQVGEGVDKGGDLVDDKTGSSFSGQVDQAQDFITGQVGGDRADEDPQPARPA